MRRSEWSDFVLAMADLYDERDADDRSKKFKTPAISPALYADGATRLDDNVTGWGAWMGIDIDNVGPIRASIDDVLAALEAEPVDYLVHTTMKATRSHHRLRALIPLSRALGRDEVRQCWDAVCRKFSALGPDGCCKDLSRIYVAPTKWRSSQLGNANPYNEFLFRVQGDVLDIDRVVLDFPPPAAPLIPMAVARETGERVRTPVGTGGKPLPAGLSSLNHPCVTACMIEGYINSPKGAHHTELYRFMTRVALRAATKGFAITADDLVAVAREVDRMSPIRTNPDRWSRIHYEAERALQFSRSR